MGFWAEGGRRSASGTAGEAGEGLGEDLRALAEGEADQGAGRLLVVVEDGGGDGDDAGAFGEGAAELDAVPVVQAGDVGGDEVGALRRVHLEAEGGQAGHEQVAS